MVANDVPSKCPGCGTPLGFYSTHTCRENAKPPERTHDWNDLIGIRGTTKVDSEGTTYIDPTPKQKLKNCILSQIESATTQVSKLDMEIEIYKKILKQLDCLQ